MASKISAWIIPPVRQGFSDLLIHLQGQQIFYNKDYCKPEKQARCGSTDALATAHKCRVNKVITVNRVIKIIRVSMCK